MVDEAPIDTVILEEVRGGDSAKNMHV